MDIEIFLKQVEDLGIDFYTGVPDSQLKALVDTIMAKYGVCRQHIVAANEGAAMGLAAGHYLATGKPALVYMQNSGIGNAVNPLCSLLNDKVYAIPALLVVGWRGAPGIMDEPQHVFQGEITVKLLEDLDVKTFVLDSQTTEEMLASYFTQAKDILAAGRQCAFVVKKGALKTDQKMKYKNDYTMTREEAVQVIADMTCEGDIYVSTTGKLSRELFEAREAREQGHQYDFLTVGSMGHASMIALGIANEKPERKVFCLDGDGAAIMHMGSMGVVGANQPHNYIHVLVNNGAHETVGGVPTVSKDLDYAMLAESCGYKVLDCADNTEALKAVLEQARTMVGPVFLEVRTDISSRADLGRPTTTPIQNREAFMAYIK